MSCTSAGCILYLKLAKFRWCRVESRLEVNLSGKLGAFGQRWYGGFFFTVGVIFERDMWLTTLGPLLVGLCQLPNTYVARLCHNNACIIWIVANVGNAKTLVKKTPPPLAPAPPSNMSHKKSLSLVARVHHGIVDDGTLNATKKSLFFSKRASVLVSERFVGV